MKKIIPLLLATLLVITTIESHSIQMESLSDEANLSHSSANEELILVGEAIVHLVNDDVKQSVNKFLIKDSVMDSEGNTYILGNLRDAGIVLDELPRVNLNDDLLRDAERFSPVIAKMNSIGSR